MSDMRIGGDSKSTDKVSAEHRPSSRVSFMSDMRIGGDSKTTDKVSAEHMYSWYFSREEIENISPSRKDGIDARKEAELRQLYWSFLRDVGIKLKLPQITIATSMMFCHRFYLHQSHAKNGWQTVATACIFLASKVEDTPCPLDVVIRAAYETMYRRDPAAARRIKQKDVFEKQKALILVAERLLLTTIRFDFNIQHPYRPLLNAMKKFGLTQKEVKQVAWNFVNDSLRTTLCLQYKPHYVAAGSLYLAAKLHNIRLPLERGTVWWHEFDVAPKPLEAVIQEMMELHGLKKHVTYPVKQIEAPPKAKLQMSSSPDSVLSRPALSTSCSSHEDKLIGDSDHELMSRCNGDGENPCQTSLDTNVATESAASSAEPVMTNCNNSSGARNRENLCSDQRSVNVAAGCEGITPCVQPSQMDLDHLSSRLKRVDSTRIKEMLRKRKQQREMNKQMDSLGNLSAEAWIERELESGIVIRAEAADKKQRL